MARRESYEISFQCPICKNNGNVQISENENFVHTRGEVAQKIESISDGFHQGNGMTIICDKCHISVPH